MFVLAVLLCLPGCALEWTREHHLYCPLQEQPQIRDMLYFGRSIPGCGEVGDAEWKSFETEVIARAFPQGFTVLEAHGAWRGANGETAAEPTRIVVIVHAEDAAAESSIRDIAQRYRTTFRQEAVMRERSAVCVSF